MRSWIMALLSLATAGALAQTSVVALWPDGLPKLAAPAKPQARPQAGPERLEGERIGNVTEPTLTVYPASYDRPAGTAVIICPAAVTNSCPLRARATSTRSGCPTWA